MDAQIIEKGFERVWKLFEETDRKFQESERKNEQEFQNLRLTMQEMSKETDLRFQELSKRVDLTSQEVAHMSQEVDRVSQQVDRTSREVDRVSKELGRLGNRLGEFVEYLIKPALVKLFQARGLDVHKVYRDIEANNSQLGLSTQIDLLVVNITLCILIEVKSHLSIDDVNEHLERMDKFKPLFPEYENRQVLGAVSGMVVPDNVARYAYKKGFFVIGQKGETAVILNDEQFKPTVW